MDKRRQKRYAPRPRIIPAATMLLGFVMMFTPFLVAHSGYINDVMIASERTTKPPFDHSLILIGSETVDGSIGIILNKPLSEQQRATLSPFIRNSGVPVGYGGPMKTSEQILVIEEKPGRNPGDPHIFDISTWDDALQDTPDLLDRIRASLKKGEQRYRIVTGYVGWGPFQLEWETLVKRAWHSIPETHDLVFQNGPKAQWDELDRAQKAKAAPPANQS